MYPTLFPSSMVQTNVVVVQKGASLYVVFGLGLGFGLVNGFILLVCCTGWLW